MELTPAAIFVSGPLFLLDLQNVFGLLHLAIGKNTTRFELLPSFGLGSYGILRRSNFAFYLK